MTGQNTLGFRGKVVVFAWLKSPGVAFVKWSGRPGAGSVTLGLRSSPWLLPAALAFLDRGRDRLHAFDAAGRSGGVVEKVEATTLPGDGLED